MKKLICLIMTIMMLFTFSSCYVKQAKYEKGSLQGYIAFMDAPLQVALRSDTDVFDIDNVSFDFYIGTYNIKDAKRYKMSPGDFYHVSDNPVLFLKEICVDYDSYNDVWDEYIHEGIIEDYRKIPYTIIVEDFSSKALTTEYGYKRSMWIGGYKYNHKEKWEVPKECFINDIGVISLGVSVFERLEKGNFLQRDVKCILLGYEKMEGNKIKINYGVNL